jgi:uncharacterized membrane protein YphA (DoxX/SURF4 family)
MAPSDSPRTTRLCRWWLLGTPLLLAMTYPLWLPVRSAPYLPLLPIPTPVTDALGWVAIALGVRRALTVVSESAIAYSAVGLALLMIGDQLRWQPWAYHALLVALAVVMLSSHWAITMLRLLTASVYLFAGWSKLDFAFATTLGQQLIELSPTEVAEGLRIPLALVGPALEVVIGVLLIFPRTRWPAALAAAVLHGVTLLLLSPWGLGHSWGVLVWNVVFPAHVLILMTPGGRRSAEPVSDEKGETQWLRGASPSQTIATAILLLALVAPLGHRFGYWDNWPSWALYAPGGERGAVFIHSAAVDQIQPALLSDRDVNETWRRVRFDEWLLAENLAPRYPQNRVLLKLADWLGAKYGVRSRLRVELQGAADRWTGERVAESVD